VFEVDVLPNHVQMPPAWSLDRLRYCTAKHWWEAAWSGLAEIRVHAPPPSLNEERRSLYRMARNQMEDCRRIRKLYRGQLMPESIRKAEEVDEDVADDDVEGKKEAAKRKIKVILTVF
jgi:hypothetical protein